MPEPLCQSLWWLPQDIYILIGDLHIIFDKRLRKIVYKAPKFRENECTDIEKAKATIAKGIDDCINTWRTKKGISKIFLLERKTTITKQIDNKIVELKNRSSYHKASTNLPRNHQIRKSLDD